MVKIGDCSEKVSGIYDWRVDFENEDGSPDAGIARRDASRYPLILAQDIYSTTDKDLSHASLLELHKLPGVKRLTRRQISLTQEECLKLDKVRGIGFRRCRKTGQMSFMVPVRVILQWHDVRASWTAEVCKRGWFSRNPKVINPVWSKEVKFATIEHHGHRIGAKGKGD